MPAQPAKKIDPLDEQIKAWHDDIELHAKDCLKIKDHQTAKILPFTYNRGQRILHRIVEQQKKAQGYVRILLLKSRRFGGSTYVEGRDYSLTSQNFNRNTFIVAHEDRSTTTLFRMAKLMHQQNPVSPATLASNAKELRFDTEDGKGLKSEYQLATAKTVDAGRSQGIHYLHASEEAFWQDGRPLLDGILQCVPDPPAESEVIRESTANGYGNSFQQDVSTAYAEGRYPYYQEGNNVYAWSNPDPILQFDWVLVFIPWFIIERYTREFKNQAQKEAFIEQCEKKVFDKEDLRWVDSESLKLKRKHNLTWEQLNWREWAIQNKCGGSIDKFHQEYPSNVEEAFLSEGSNVFGKELCDRLEELCEKPIVIGDPVIRGGSPRIKRNPHGKLSIWERPDKRESYFLTVDSAGGKKEHQEKDNREPDYTCIDVFNHRTGVQCAQWHGHIDYDLIADMVEMVGDMYFRCPAVVELFNHGYTVVAFLERKNYPMYEQRPGQPGWITTRSAGNTKADAVDSLYQMVRDGDLQIKSKETVSEMRTFIEKDGKYGAASGCNDDRITTGCIASKMMLILPKKFEALREKKKKFTGFMNFPNKMKEENSGDYQEVYVG